MHDIKGGTRDGGDVDIGGKDVSCRRTNKVLNSGLGPKKDQRPNLVPNKSRFCLQVLNFFRAIQRLKGALCKIALLGSYRIFLARNSQCWNPGGLIEVGVQGAGRGVRQPAVNRAS